MRIDAIAVGRHPPEDVNVIKPGKWVMPQGWGDADDARHFIQAAIERSRAASAGP
jgi:inorganic pyrophosphatase